MPKLVIRCLALALATVLPVAAQGAAAQRRATAATPRRTLSKIVQPQLRNAVARNRQPPSSSGQSQSPIALVTGARLAAGAGAPTMPAITDYSLTAGDFEKAKRSSAAARLDFFALAEATCNPTSGASRSALVNPDRAPLLATLAKSDSPNLLPAFEETFGTETRTFDDVFLALDLGKKGARPLVTAPEPGTAVTLGTFLAIAWLAKGRRRRAAFAA